MRKIKPLAAVAMSGLLVLTGCGGDGNGDGGSGAASTALTKENAATASAVAHQATGALFGAADTLSSEGLATGAVVHASPGASNRRGGLASFTAQQIRAASQRAVPKASGVVGVVTEETYPCSGGGTVAVRYDDADNNEEDSAGDSLRLSFTNCIEEGITANGVASAKLTSVSGNSFGAQATFDNLTLRDGTDSVGANGGFDFTYTDQGDGTDKLVITGQSLTAVVSQRPQASRG